MSARDAKYNSSAKGKYRNYRREAKTRELTFDLTLEEFSGMISRPCHYCGEASGGLDRCDNTLGYTKFNTVPCCFRCNRAKNDLTEQEFVEMCLRVANNAKFGPNASVSRIHMLPTPGKSA